MRGIEELREIIENAEKIVFFGGAGVSTESGIPDFRSSDGLYSEDTGDYPPEVILSHSFLFSHPKAFYRYYRSRMLYPDARPNSAHRYLAELERRGKLTAVVTQNIDGLHSAAGSVNVLELHGSVRRNYCADCGKGFSLSYVTDSDGVPACDLCGGFVRPDVVMYGEALPGEAFSAAEEAISEADVLIVGGTSLTVYPAAGLIDAFEGEHLIIINKTETPYDDCAEYIFREPIGEVFEALED